MTLLVFVLLAAGYPALAVAAVAAVRRARSEVTLAEREDQALEIHDNVVQGLTQVNWALEAGAYDVARDAARAALVEAQELVGELLEEHPDGHAFGPGSLRRRQGSGERA